MRMLIAIAAAGALAVAGCDGKHDDGHDHGGATDGGGASGDGHAHEHGAMGHGADTPAAAPATLAEAAARIDAAHQELEAIVKEGDLAKAHAVADRMAKLAAAVPELATKAGLPPAEVKEVNLASKELQALFGAVDEAGDAGKRPEAQAAFAKYAAPLATIMKHARHGR